MREKPILFSTPMVKAILDGRKSQTRRVIKPQPPDNSHNILQVWQDPGSKRNYTHLLNSDYYVWFPYGQIGSKIWIRETTYQYGRWFKNGFTKTGKQKWTFRQMSVDVPLLNGCNLRYYDNPPEPIRKNSYGKEGWYKRPSIFMPRMFSRITLEVTDVRVELLQNITEQDAVREGFSYRKGDEKFSISKMFSISNIHPPSKRVEEFNSYFGKTEQTTKEGFAEYWDLINQKRGYGWLVNPFVWVISFKRII